MFQSVYGASIVHYCSHELEDKNKNSQTHWNVKSTVQVPERINFSKRLDPLDVPTYDCVSCILLVFIANNTEIQIVF